MAVTVVQIVIIQVPGKASESKLSWACEPLWFIQWNMVSRNLI